MRTLKIALFFLGMLIVENSLAQSGPRNGPYNGTLRFTLAQGGNVYQDSSGSVYTLYDLGQKNQQIMMGTPYLEYPTWQEGSIQLKENMPEMSCKIAFNVASNEVLCRFNDDTTTYKFKPVSFTIWDKKFVRLANHGYPVYYQVLYNGNTQLLGSYKRQMTLLKPQPYGNKFFIGYFLGIERYYYLKLPNSPLRAFTLTRKSFLRALGNNIDPKRLPVGETLTLNDVVQVLADSPIH